ncbi:MAG TPA: STAS domain-containing protein [Vicinamibacterales bacterium]|nr:STAS domain-containing protein [Vicinamibacterales bacterium]
MQIRTSIEPTGAVTLTVDGPFTGAAVADFERALERARCLDQPMFLDLTGVPTIDQPTLKYLVNVMRHDFRLIICPAFVEQWIARQDGG